MRDGDTLRFRGPAGAEFVVTVGAAFDERTIKARVESGEWTPLNQDRAEAGSGGPPAQNAPKSDWVDWAVAARGLYRDDAEAMTKKDLVALADTE